MRPPRKPASRLPGCLLALLSLALATAGCGGAKHASGGSAPGNGTAVVNIEWPARAPDPAAARTIPAATESIVLRVFTDRELTDLRRVVSRPTSAGNVAVRFEGIPLGPMLFVAEAHGDAQGEALPLLASGSQTVTITPGDPVSVAITLSTSSTPSGGDGNTGIATVIVSDIPASATSIRVRVLQNGQTIPGVGEPASIARTSDLPFSAVPLRLADLPVGSLLFVATAAGPNPDDPTQQITIAQGSKIAEVSASAETTVSLPLVQGTGTIPGDGGQTQPTTGSVIVNITNIGTGDVLLVVDPLPGDQSLTDPAPVQVRLQGSFVANNLPVSRVPVLVSGLPPGPWLFMVTSHSGPSPSDPVNRSGTATADIKAGDRLTLDAPLGNTQLGSPPKQDGELSVLSTNITGQGLQTLVVSVFDSTERVKYQAVEHTVGVNERLVTFTLPGGSYTVVSAAYARDRETILGELADSRLTSIPPSPLSVGSATVTVESAKTASSAVELRLQAGSAGAGTVNLAMLQVPVRVEQVQVGDTGLSELRIVSGLVVKVFSVSDNQELAALRRVMLPPTILVTGTSPEDFVMRLRLDGVPAGLMRFEVAATASSDGSGPLLGTGSAIADVKAGTTAIPPVTAVTVAVLPHGDLPSGTFLPGAANVDDPTNNPSPDTPARLIRNLFRIR